MIKKRLYQAAFTAALVQMNLTGQLTRRVETASRRISAASPAAELELELELELAYATAWVTRDTVRAIASLDVQLRASTALPPVHAGPSETDPSVPDGLPLESIPSPTKVPSVSPRFSTKDAAPSELYLRTGSARGKDFRLVDMGPRGELRADDLISLAVAMDEHALVRAW